MEITKAEEYNLENIFFRNIKPLERKKYSLCVKIFNNLKNNIIHEIKYTEDLLKNKNNANYLIQLIDAICVHIIYIKKYSKIEYSILSKVVNNYKNYKELVLSKIKNNNCKFNKSIVYEDIFVNDGENPIMPLSFYTCFFNCFLPVEWEIEENDLINNILVIKALRYNKIAKMIVAKNLNILLYKLHETENKIIFEEVINIVLKILFHNKKTH